jgi:hypothetical protein
MNLTRGSALLVISDAAAQIADPGHQAHLSDRRLISAWPRKHVGDLGYLTFRLLVSGVEFLAKRLAGRVLDGPGVHTKILLSIRVAKGDDLPVADIAAKNIEVPIQEPTLSLGEATPCGSTRGSPPAPRGPRAKQPTAVIRVRSVTATSAKMGSKE